MRWIGRKCNLIGSAAGRPEADPYRRTVGHRFVGGGLPDAPTKASLVQREGGRFSGGGIVPAGGSSPPYEV